MDKFNHRKHVKYKVLKKRPSKLKTTMIGSLSSPFYLEKKQNDLHDMLHKLSNPGRI